MIYKNCKSYLTIDDSPSTRMDDLTDYLKGKGIPAIFFCRGDRLVKNPDAATRAVKDGFTLANHSDTHQRSSERDVNWIITDIEKAQQRLDEIYIAANSGKVPRYFRFPHVDRGTGGWIVDYDAYNGADKDAVLAAFAEGLNVTSMEKPDQAALAKKQALQSWLKNADYAQPFKNVTHRWFSTGEIADAADCLYTYSNCDWMLTERHRGKWPYKTLDDLKQRARHDKALTEEGSVNVILAHDQAEIIDVTIDLIEDLATNGMQFLDI